MNLTELGLLFTRLLKETLMRDRVGAEMSKRMDTGVRVNRALLGALGVEGGEQAAAGGAGARRSGTGSL